MKFVLNIDTEKRNFPRICPCAYINTDHVCGWCSVVAAACKGLLAERPEHCPLVEVKDET